MLTGWVLRPSGRMLAYDQRFCDSCRANGLAWTARTLVGLLIRSARAAAAPSSLAIRTVPPGAQIVLDDKVVGATDMKFRVYPGRHLVRLDKAGFASATREVILDDGEHAIINVTLARGGASRAVVAEAEAEAPPGAPAPSHPPRAPAAAVSRVAPPPPRRSRLVPSLVMGAGGAAVATGALLLALGGDQAFDGGSRRTGDVTDLTPLAIGVGSAGLLAIGAGAYLWWRSGDGRAGPAPLVSLGGGAASIGVQASF